jgi:uncharacterized membrane protein
LERFRGGSFTVGDVFNWSIALFKERAWPIIFMFWGVAGLNWALNIGMEWLQRGLMAAAADPALSFLIVVGMQVMVIVIQLWLGIGMNLGLLKIARQRPVSPEVLFTGGRSLVTLVLACIVLVGMLVVPALGIAVALSALFVAVLPAGPLVAILFLLGCGGSVSALGLYLVARLLQFYFLVIDRNFGILDSIRGSWQLTQGRAATIILVYGVQICVVLGGFLACCVGLVVALPVSSVMSVVTYLALAEPPKAAPPSITWIEEP